MKQIFILWFIEGIINLNSILNTCVFRTHNSLHSKLAILTLKDSLTYTKSWPDLLKAFLTCTLKACLTYTLKACWTYTKSLLDWTIVSRSVHFDQSLIRLLKYEVVSPLSRSILLLTDQSSAALLTCIFLHFLCPSVNLQNENIRISNLNLTKFADDTAIQGLIISTSDVIHILQK